MLRIYLKILTLIGFILICSINNTFASHPQDEDDEWNPVSAGPVTTWTAPLCGKAKFVIQPFFFYNRTRGTFNSDNHYDSLPAGDKKYQYQQQLFMQYGLTDKLGTDSLGATSGGGSFDHGYGLILTKKIKPFVLHLDTVYSFPLERKIDNVKTQYAPYLNYDFGLEYILPRGFNLMLEFNGFLQGDKKQDGDKTPTSDIKYLTIAPGVGWSCNKIQMLLAYQRTLAGTNTDANDSVVFTSVYTF